MALDRGVWLGILAMSCWAAAGNTVNGVIALVRTAIGNQQQDSRIARALHRVQLTERLDDHTIEELESEGAGPKSLAELERLRELSSALPKPSAPLAFADRPAPSPEEQDRMVAEARRNALSYTGSLPDFICTEVVRRYNDSRRKLVDTLTLQLRYAGHRENYQLLTINGRRTYLPYDSVGGVVTQGEFGSLLSEVFERGAAAEFRWDHWTTLHKRPAQVYTFRIPVERSNYRIEAQSSVRHYSAAVGQHGVIYVDRDTRRTLRIVAEADGIPADFPVHDSSTTLEYGFVDIGDRQYLLPLHAEVRMKTVEMATRNDVEFSGYKKFAADSTITFEPH